MNWQNYPYQFEGLEKHLERILQKKAELDQLRPIPSYAVKSIKESLMLEWTYNSNSIEGNTLTLHETKVMLKGDEAELNSICQSNPQATSINIEGKEIKGKCALGFKAPHP